MNNYAQHESLCQVEELHAGQGHNVIGHFVIETLQLDAPAVFGRHPDHLDNLLGLVVDLGRVQADGQRASHQEDEREPEVHRMPHGGLLAKSVGEKGRVN